MRTLEDSPLYRGCRRIAASVAGAGRESRTGRLLAAATRAVGRAFSSSVLLGTQSISSVPLANPGQPLSVLAIAKPYVYLRRVVAEGFAGKAVGRLSTWSGHSSYVTANWVRLVGAALLGMGCGRFVLTALGRLSDGGGTILARGTVVDAIVVPIILVVAGIFLVAYGPLSVRTLADIWAHRGSRGSSSPSATRAGLSRPSGGTAPMVITGALVCGGAGLAVGIAGRSGPAWLALSVLLVVALGALLWRPEGILVVFAAFPWFDEVARSGLGGLGPAWDEGLLLLSVFLVLWSAVVLGRATLVTVPIVLPALCVLALGLVSIVVNDVPGEVGLFGLRAILQPVLYYLIAFQLFTDRRWTRVVVGVFLVSSVALAAHALYQYGVGVPLVAAWNDVRGTSIETRAYSVISNPNGLGALLAMSCLVTIALLLAPGMRRLQRAALAAGLVLQLGGIAVTFSRSAWIGLGCGLVVVLVVAYRRWLIPVLAVVAVGLAAAPRILWERVMSGFSGGILTGSAMRSRLSRWTAAFDQAVAHPWFGVGLGTYGGEAAQRFGFWNVWVDNYYLQMAAEGGLLLVAAFVWLLVRVAKGLLKGYRIAADPFARALTAGALGGFVAVVVANVFISDLETLPVGVAFWFLAGSATALALKSGRTTPSEDPVVTAGQR